MKNTISVFVTLAAITLSAFAADARRDCDALVDDLQNLDSFVAGFHPTAWVDQFLAVDTPPKFAGGVLGSRAPVVFAPMRELVKRGPEALPVLLKHLDDKRPTKLEIREEGIITWVRYTNKYNNRPLGKDPSYKIVEEYGELPYRVTVGDVCLVLLGQITDREQCGVRYAPTGGVQICSPTKYPEIVREARADWSGVGPDELFQHLLADIRGTDADCSVDGVLVRISTYFPSKISEAEKIDRARQANQALVPTPASVTPAADAPVAPDAGAAHL